MKRILFVDDEPQILEGLQNLLRRQRSKWEMVFALGGEKALEILEQGPFDVIVTDMRMPGVDGSDLLKIVQEKYTNTVRIVLSGYTELQASLRAIPVAHQFLTKPCKPAELENVVERACSLQTLIDDDALQKTIGKIDTLPPLPRMYAALTKALADPDTGADTVAKILEKDMAMCAKLLQLVNSSFFVSAKQITSVQFAVVRLGFQIVKNLVLSLEVFKSNGPIQIEGFSAENLQQHALLVANVAKQLCSDPQQSEDAFMAAMLHDIGTLIMAMELPNKLKDAIKLSEEEGIALHTAEEKLFGVTHAEIGAYLLGAWGLPYPIVEAVANHHRPTRVLSHGFCPLSAVYIAECLIEDQEAEEETPSSLDLGYLQELGVSDQIEGWRKITEKLMAGAEEGH